MPCAPLPDGAAGAVVVVAFFFGAFLQSSTTYPLRQSVSFLYRLR